MKRKLNSALAWLLGSALYCAGVSTAVADDTEIFFNTNYKDSTRPNVLFIFDTSGSMNFNDATGKKRIDTVKEAMSRLLDQVTNVNVGLARYSQPGAAILYPVRNVEDSADPSRFISVSGSTDDAEEASDGTMNLTSRDLDIIEETDHAEWVGIRFQNVNVPQGAKITGAALGLYAAEASSANIKIRVYGERPDASSGSTLTFSSTAKNISTRNRTSKYADWTPDSFTTVDAQYDVEKLEEVIQEIVDNPKWCGGNAIVLLMQRQSGTGKRVAHSYDQGSTKAPMLSIKFDPTFESGDTACYVNQTITQVASSLDDVEENTSGKINATQTELNTLAPGSSAQGTVSNYGFGLRFKSIAVPKGADITEATITFYNAVKSTQTKTIKVAAAAKDDIDSFSTSNFALSSGLPKTSAVSTLTMGSFDTVAKAYTLTGSFDAVIEEVTNRSGWVLGNDLALIFYSASGDKHFMSSDSASGAGYAPKLTIKFRGAYDPGAYRVREELKESMNGFKATGDTPISDSLLEGGFYYRGDATYFGKYRGGMPGSSEKLVSHSETYSGGTEVVPAGCNLLLNPFSNSCRDHYVSGSPKYITPIVDTCQSNHIIFLTDGEPTAQFDKEAGGIWPTGTHTFVKNLTGTTCKTNDSGADCTKKIAKFLHEKDQNSSLPGNQTVTTHTIGFDLSGSNGPNFLKEVASQGGGGFYEANSTDSLLDAFNDIVSRILQANATFVSAGVTVSQANRTAHLNQLYFSLFGPTITPRWPGNLKLYKLVGGNIVDANGAVAVDGASDQFIATSKSYWSPDIDGNDPSLGGAASKLTAARKVYSNITGNTNVTLTTGNSLTKTLLPSVFGVSTTSERDQIVDWALGVDVDDSNSDGSITDANNVMGDPLHSKPTLIRYKSGATETLRVYVATNHGYLQSINADTTAGTEAWAFIPKSLLPNLQILRRNNEGDPRPYGMDSTVSIYRVDSDNNGAIDVGTDKAYLMVGMRRGGDQYYTFDISNPDAPKLMYIIDGGSADFAKLSQTWSVPTIVKMPTTGGNKVVALFGGGYDIDQDTNGDAQSDDIGNVVYAVDLLTGTKLWDSSMDPDGGGPLTAVTGMNSVPSDVRAVDLNSDGLADHFYVSDTAAQVFRFDIANNGVITGGRLAHFQPVSALKENNRRFYPSVDSALIVRTNGQRFIAVNIGSGYREHPLETAIKDRFYSIRDFGVFTNTIKKDVSEADLADITSIAGTTATVAVDAATHGWYLRLTGTGEKVLAESLTFDNVLYFTTYLPPGTASGGTDCSGNKGTSRLYAVNVIDGNPAIFGTTIDDRALDTNCATCGLIPPQIIDTGETRTIHDPTKPDDPDSDCETSKQLLVGTVNLSSAIKCDSTSRLTRAKWRHN